MENSPRGAAFAGPPSVIHAGEYSGEDQMKPPAPWFRILSLTAAAMTAFAANSLLSRAALVGGSIDAATFTWVRLASGAAVLWLLVVITRGSGRRPRTDWAAASALFTYAICFSLAYVWLGAGTGALILFAAVQLTMVSAGLLRGELQNLRTVSGMGLAMGGLAYLLFPGLSAPPVFGAALMAVAGVAWGVYSLRGGGGDPLNSTAGNFIGAVMVASVMAGPVVLVTDTHASGYGLALALLSGAAASGLGYVVWYAALRYLSATQAATVQLSVPVIAAAGGILLLEEALSLRLVVASTAILGGIGMVLRSSRPAAAKDRARKGVRVANPRRP